jgi:chemotaxis protein methyltransferase CheR
MRRAEASGFFPPAADSIRPLEQHEFEHIRRLAHRVFGLDLKPGKQELVSSRLGRLVRQGGFRSFEEYYRSIAGDRTGEALAEMIDALTTNHTAFVREPEHFDFLRREVLPQFAGRDLLDVWSAACSTGEEVWTLAGILHETIPPRRALVIGTDISTRALQFAESGVYPLDRCGGLPCAWRGVLFEPIEGATPAYRVSRTLRAYASFRRVNLIEPIAWKRNFPVIFCRNVMIYFDPPTQEKVVRQLSDCLEPGGYLFVGHAESLTRISHGLQYVRPAVYRKPDERRSRWSR